MTRKIYFNHKILFLSTSITPELQNYLHHKKVSLVKGISEDNIKKAINQIQATEIDAIVIIHENIEELYEAVAKEFTVIKAGGGLVYTPEKEILMIFRRGKWDLPKGKLDEGEDIATCALREVEEETGLAFINLQQLLTITYHTYYERGEFILKESYWYLMLINGHQELIPQTEEDIEKCEWVKINNLSPYLENSLPSIIDVINEGLPKIGINKSA